MFRRESIHATQRRRYLDYYIHDSSDALRFELAGWLSKDTASDLEQAWRTASSMIAERRVVFDLSRLAGIDGSGQSVLGEWSCRGAVLGASSHQARKRIQSMTNQPVAVLARETAGPRRWFLRAMPSWVRPRLSSYAPSMIPELPKQRTAPAKDASISFYNPMKVPAPAASVLLEKPSIS